MNLRRDALVYPFYQTNTSKDLNFFNSYIDENLSFPPHLHSFVELAYIIEGNIDVTVNGITCRLSAGDIAVCFPNDIHSYNTTNSSKLILVIYSPQITDSFFKPRTNKTLKNPFILNKSKNKEIAPLFLMLNEEYNKGNNEYIIKGLLYTILGKLEPDFVIENSAHPYNNTMQNLLKYIEGHYNENITLEQVSGDLGFSKFYISRLFSGKIGYPFSDYVNRLRINMAQKLLYETDIAISSIALECGFNSQRNFNRIFKEFTSVTPTEFRTNSSKQ